LRCLEGWGRKVAAGSVGDVYIGCSEDQPRPMGSQAKIQVIEVKSELLVEAHLPNFSKIDGQK